MYTGYTIPPHFDSMCLKLIVWALSWEEALNRGRRALADMRLMGVKTTAPFYDQILQEDEFRSGRFDTGYLPRHPELTRYSEKARPAGSSVGGGHGNCCQRRSLGSKQQRVKKTRCSSAARTAVRNF